MENGKKIGLYFRKRRQDLHLKQRTIADGLTDKGSKMGLTKYNQLELGEGLWTIEIVTAALALFDRLEADHAAHVQRVKAESGKSPTAQPAK